MARSFNGTSDTATVALDLSGTPVLSIAFWLWWDAFSNNDDLAMEFTLNFNTVFGAFMIDPNAAAGTFKMNTSSLAGVFNGASFTRPSAAAWHHYVFVVDTGRSTNEIGPIYVDGSAQSLTNSPNNNSTGNFANSTLHIMHRGEGADSLFGAGDMAELAIWSAELTAGQAGALARGASPIQVRPGSSLELYLPMYGVTSPEADFSTKRRNATVTGATRVNHAPAGRPVALPYLSNLTPNVGGGNGGNGNGGNGGGDTSQDENRMGGEAAIRRSPS